MNTKRLAFTCSVLILSALLLSSCSGSEDIPKNTRLLLDTLGWDFHRIHPSELENVELATIHDRYYLANESAGKLWRDYLDSDPASQWTGPMANFAGLYDSESDQFYTCTDHDIPGFAVGQVMFLDLVVEHIKHFPTAFVITEIDENRKAFVFKYIEGNPAEGMQQVQFIPLSGENGSRTLIRHRSWFINNSGIRNRLYPAYHEHAIDEFHSHVARAADFRIRVISEKKLTKKGLIPLDPPL